LSASLLTHLPLRAERAVVRRLLATDLAAFRAYRTDPELARYQGWSSMNEVEAAAFIDEMVSITALIPGDWVQLGIADIRTDQLLGDIGLFLSDDEGSAEIGFTLSAHAQGRGVATDAVRAALQVVFTTSPVQTVRAITDVRNHASIRLLERLRFAFVSKEDTVFKGEPCTESTYTMSRERWEQP
jgi:[ribosomal protein S5]-alanine N-acetyltransferase